MASGIAREAVGTFDILVFTGPEEILKQFEKKSKAFAYLKVI